MMSERPSGLLRFIHEEMKDPRSGWAVGTFGAVAEFICNEAESEASASPLCKRNVEGAIRLDISDDVHPFAYEVPGGASYGWQHGVALCLPSEKARRAARTSITELGEDRSSIAPLLHKAQLFDLGIGAAQADFCIRTEDPVLIRSLRRATGRSIFDPGISAMSDILATHPTRVVITNIGRCEVYQKIGGPDTGGMTPKGPHTHLLPSLLKTGRTHSANIDVPAGYIPCASIYPAHPVGKMDRTSGDMTFDKTAHLRFQDVLEKWGDPSHLSGKEWALRGISSCTLPDATTAPLDRAARRGAKVAIRQLAYLFDDTEIVRSYSQHFDRRMAETISGR